MRCVQQGRSFKEIDRPVIIAAFTRGPPVVENAVLSWIESRNHCRVRRPRHRRNNTNDPGRPLSFTNEPTKIRNLQSQFVSVAEVSLIHPINGDYDHRLLRETLAGSE